jgi:hypothetical protein
MVLSKVEGLTTLSDVEGESSLFDRFWTPVFPGVTGLKIFPKAVNFKPLNLEPGTFEPL